MVTIPQKLANFLVVGQCGAIVGIVGLLPLSFKEAVEFFREFAKGEGLQSPFSPNLLEGAFSSFDVSAALAHTQNGL